MKIVIIEDEVNIREGIKKILKKWSSRYEVSGEAENGGDGLALVRNHLPDIVITDIRMPGMDGLEMIKQIQAENKSVQFIVISAYSEFEYARTAMKLGVTEYLLKPINITELLQALENIELKWKKAKREKPEEIGTLEQVFRDFLEGTMHLDKEIENYMFHAYGITADTPLMAVCAYLGQNYKTMADAVMKDLRHIFSLETLPVSIFSLQERTSVMAVVYRFTDQAALERYLQRQLLSGKRTEAVYGAIAVPSISELETGFQKLFPYMDWNISFQDEILISYPKITKVRTVPCIYPIETETKCKVAICSGKWMDVQKHAKEFQESFLDGKLYAPKEIKESYIRFIWAMTGIANEIGALRPEQTDQQLILERIVNAKRREELNQVMEQVLAAMITEENDGVTHLTVKRVLNMIHEFYQTGITLEQISEKLNVTPEYVGTQFHKEVGMTFSAYMRNYRINKAKELLCGTDLKLYQISRKVGYADSNYFSRVFKEVTGQLPAEYRKTYK